jgi:hypothetical protein
MFKGKIKIIDSNNKIEKSILDACRDEAKKIFTKAIPKIRADVINLTVDALSKSPEIKSLQYGTLKFDFGLTSDPTTTLIYAIANSVDVYFKGLKLNKNSTTNVLSIYIQPSDFQNILNLPDAYSVTELGNSLPWLEWLLTAGDAILVKDYHVEYGNYSQSRSGGAIMVPKSIFKVNSSFSGTEDDNFITRALANYDKELATIVEKSI